MMRIDLKYVELHTPMFLAGTNLQTKLDVSKRENLHLIYDTDMDLLLIYFKGHLSFQGSVAAAAMQPYDSSVLGPVPGPRASKHEPPKPTGKPIEAQVSTPQSHVFAGLGQGKAK